jgi:hypothetical protein
MVMKAFWQIYKISVYTNVDVSIKLNWQGLLELANISQESDIQKRNFKMISILIIQTNLKNS